MKGVQVKHFPSSWLCCECFHYCAANLGNLNLDHGGFLMSTAALQIDYQFLLSLWAYFRFQIIYHSISFYLVMRFAFSFCQGQTRNCFILCSFKFFFQRIEKWKRNKWKRIFFKIYCCDDFEWEKSCFFAFIFLHKLARLIYQYLLALNKMSHIDKKENKTNKKSTKKHSKKPHHVFEFEHIKSILKSIKQI